MLESAAHISDSQRQWVSDRIEAGADWEEVIGRLQQDGLSAAAAIGVAEDILAQRRRIHRLKGVLLMACGSAIFATALLLLFLASLRPAFRDSDGAWEILTLYATCFFPFDLGLVVLGIDEWNRGKRSP